MDPGLSWVKGDVQPPLLDFTIGRALDLAAARWGDADAVVSVAQGVRWSWRELALKADAMAAGLWPWASNAETASGSGRPIAPNGP